MKILKTITINLFVGANIATLALLWVSCLVTYLPPGVMPRLTLLSLLFPAFLLLNLAFVVFWLIFKIRLTWIPVAGIAAVFFFVRDYFPINIPSPAPADSWKVITYNTLNFGGNLRKKDVESNVVVDYLAESNADIICLQESGKGGCYDLLCKKMEGLGYEIVEHKGKVLCTRLHIISSDTLHYPTRSNGGFKALLEDGPDTILLINNHFESNHLTQAMRDDYKDAVRRHERDSMLTELSPILSMLVKAVPMRGAQADTIQALIESWLPRPIILCGDFNDTPISYTHRRLTTDLTSAYTQSGMGLGFTFHDKGFPVHIDHILFTGGHFHSFDTHVDHSIDVSDHFPLITFLTKSKENAGK